MSQFYDTLELTEQCAIDVRVKRRVWVTPVSDLVTQASYNRGGDVVLCVKCTVHLCQASVGGSAEVHWPFCVVAEVLRVVT